MAEELRIAADESRDVESMLAEILTRLDRIEQSVEVLDDASREVPNLVAAATDTADFYIRRAQDRGIDVDERARRLAGLVERITEPEVLDALEFVIDALKDAPGLVAMVADIIDDHIGRAVARGADVNQMTRSAVKGAVKLSEFVLSEEFTALLDSGMLDPSTVRVVGRAGRALADVSDDETETPGLLGLLRRSRQTNVRRSLSFGIRVSRRFGELMHSREQHQLEDKR